jgi:RimJ/RimL family protein N-acetyltransferase
MMNDPGKPFDPAADGAVALDKGIYLRPMRESDINDRYLSWFIDPEVTKFLDSRRITREEALEFLRWGKRNNRRFMYAICVEATGLHIGNVKIGDVYPRSMLSDLVTVIGDRDYWGKGVAATAIRLATKIAFEKHDIRKLSGGIESDNIGSLKAYLRAGWVMEAVLHAHYGDADGKHDRLVVSCFNPRFHPKLPSFPVPLVSAG